MPQPHDIRLVGFPSAFDLGQRIERRVEAGQTLADLVELIVPDWQEDEAVGIEAAVSGNRIDHADWSRARPKAGTQVLVLAGPTDDGLRTFLQVAVTVAAIASGQFYATGILGLQAGSLGAGFVSAAVSSTALVGGSAQLDALATA